MESFDIVLLIAIILFARLGLRLITGYNEIFKDGDKTDEDERFLDSARNDKDPSTSLRTDSDEDKT